MKNRRFGTKDIPPFACAIGRSGDASLRLRERPRGESQQETRFLSSSCVSPVCVGAFSQLPISN
ncbi:MAG TPA: hypothetical protein DDW76_13630 [Cyanobacteria bacterium UBA11369]|nr:hypothetical protein [Cyanobacteria bacterium UBA11371]HBE31726.1 hypothetical protein [Cyanobacteria bacterium UBA11368]HBE49797.1 hypothetical protein [Cyanobacteria bacterium UBA11369]